MSAASPRSTARTYRTLMWLLAVAGLFSLVIAVDGARSGGAARSGIFALVIFFLCVALGAWLGLQGARILREAQAQQSRQEMIVFLATELGRHDEETLRRIVRQGGPAGEAAGMVLKGRRERTGNGERGAGSRER